MSNSFTWGQGQGLVTTSTVDMPSSQNQEIQTLSPETYLKLATDGMGMLQRFNFNRNSKKALSDYAEEVATMMMEHQRDSIKHQLRLDLDIEGKHRLKAYQKEILHIDRSILKAETEAKRQLKTYLEEFALSLFKEKKSKSDKIQGLVDSGEIFPEDAEALNGLINENTADHIGDTRARIMALQQSYTNTYMMTVKRD